MSIDSSEETNSDSGLRGDRSRTSDQLGLWNLVRHRSTTASLRRQVRRVFGKAAKRGAIYRWGLAASRGGRCDAVSECLSRLACGQSDKKANKAGINLMDVGDAFTESVTASSKFTTKDAAQLLLWTTALPALSEHFDSTRWWRLLTAIEQTRESILQRSRCYSPTHLMIGAEVGLTLAWRLGELPACRGLVPSSTKALSQWCDREDESLEASIANVVDTRLVLGSLIRIQKILEQGATSKKLRKQQRRMGAALGERVAAMTVPTGSSAMSDAGHKDVVDDLPPHGLLDHATRFDPDCLGPAMEASLGQKQRGGRLVWQVNLPETLHHDPVSKIALMFADWDVRRGRTHIDYSSEHVQIEVFAGRPKVISGRWETMIEIDGEEQQPNGDWVDACEYTDDDVHYLEIEQSWTGGMLVQRQLMLLRDDRCLLMADAILPSDPNDVDSRKIKYASRLPLYPSIRIDAASETREVFLSDGHHRGLVIPPSAAEWRIGPTAAVLKATGDGHLLLSAEGRGRLYAPLWFDFQKRRFSRKRTWRQLTVADQLRICRRDEAVGYRVQVGSEQWMLYRSMAERRCRSILGKHLIADFYASRFDPGDGSHDSLVTVDENESLDD